MLTPLEQLVKTILHASQGMFLVLYKIIKDLWNSLWTTRSSRWTQWSTWTRLRITGLCHLMIK